MHLVEILHSKWLMLYCESTGLCYFWIYTYKLSSVLKSWAFCKSRICINGCLVKTLFFSKSLRHMKLLTLSSRLYPLHSSCMLGMLTRAAGSEVKLHFLLFWSFQIGLSWNRYTIMTQVNCKVTEIWYWVAKSICRSIMN